MGERFAAALAAKDAAGLQSLLADEIDFRALTPSRFWEESTPEAVVGDVILGHWFDPSDAITAVESVETGHVEDRDVADLPLPRLQPRGRVHRRATGLLRRHRRAHLLPAHALLRLPPGLTLQVGPARAAG